MGKAQMYKAAARRFSNLSVREVEGEERKIILSFSSDTPYERWWGVEILSHSPDSVDLSRLNQIGILLFNHNADKVLGKILRAWIENSKGYAEVEFDDDENASGIFNKVKNGTLKGVSVGYTVESWEDVAAGKQSANGRYTGPCSIATRWTPLEISIVSVPADATVGVGRSSTDNVPVELFARERQLKINNNIFDEKEK